MTCACSICTLHFLYNDILRICIFFFNKILFITYLFKKKIASKGNYFKCLVFNVELSFTTTKFLKISYELLEILVRNPEVRESEQKQRKDHHWGMGLINALRMFVFVSSPMFVNFSIYFIQFFTSSECGF